MSEPTHDTKADPRLHEAARTASSAVQQAADVLEEQLAAGLADVRRLAGTFQAQRRLDESAFEDLVARFRATAHDVIEVAGQRAEDMRTDGAQDLAQRLTRDAHDVMDTVIDLVMLTPSLARSVRRRGRGAEAPDDAPGQAPDEQGNVDPNVPFEVAHPVGGPPVHREKLGGSA
jgi:hypothetical protein